MTLLHGVMARACKVYGLPANPLAGIERHPVRIAGDIDVFSPEEVWALVRAAASAQGSYLDGSALRRRYKSALKKAGLRQK